MLYGDGSILAAKDFPRETVIATPRAPSKKLQALLLACYFGRRKGTVHITHVQLHGSGNQTSKTWNFVESFKFE